MVSKDEEQTNSNAVNLISFLDIASTADQIE
jgi:hypothetical protein